LPALYTQPIGSLPRPRVVIDLLQQRETLPSEEFRRRMNELVIFAIRLQEQAGLDVVSDGEWRRVHYIREFLHRLGGFERIRRFGHHGETKMTEVVVRRSEPCGLMFVEEARFLSQHTDRVTKFCLPSPFLIAVRYWTAEHSTAAYPTVQHFVDHLCEILAGEARALVEAGIDIVQLDDPALTYYCDRALMAGEALYDDRLRREWNAERELPAAIEAINRIADGLKTEVHLHCCHSVYKRRSDVSGDYKPLLPFFEDLRADRVNLEFAYQGTGQMSDLKLLPEHLGVGMGVVDVRSEAVQSVEQIADLARSGLSVISPDRVALNPDCGFAPDALEPPSIDEAYEKLCRLTAVARQLRTA
jgi:5-methyltetrahydropteroyltriglutamate--homocysteine methyltransferase